MPMIISTGNLSRGRELAAALTVSGLQLRPMPDQALGTLTPGSVDVYVQLPLRDAPDQDAGMRSGLEEAARFLRHGLLARFEAAVMVRDALAPNGLVVLVSGNTPRDGTPDSGNARSQLLATLAEAIRSETADRNVEVVIAPRTVTDEELLALIQRR